MSLPFLERGDIDRGVQFVRLDGELVEFALRLPVFTFFQSKLSSWRRSTIGRIV